MSGHGWDGYGNGGWRRACHMPQAMGHMPIAEADADASLMPHVAGTRLRFTFRVQFFVIAGSERAVPRKSEIRKSDREAISLKKNKSRTEQIYFVFTIFFGVISEKAPEKEGDASVNNSDHAYVPNK